MWVSRSFSLSSFEYVYSTDIHAHKHFHSLYRSFAVTYRFLSRTNEQWLDTLRIRLTEMMINFGLKPTFHFNHPLNNAMGFNMYMYIYIHAHAQWTSQTWLAERWMILAHLEIYYLNFFKSLNKRIEWGWANHIANFWIYVYKSAILLSIRLQ